MADRLILGSGYVGLEVAHRWVSRGDRVVAVTRSPDKATSMRERGIEPLLWDWLTHLGETNLPSINVTPPRFETVLIAVTHAQQAGIAPADTHVLGLRNLKDSKLPIENASWIYLSTTGVYGSPTDSLWVDEDSPIEPTRPGSIAAWSGEEWCRASIDSTKLVVLRPAGIYGPGRLPNWQAVRDSVPLQMDPESYLNLIHRDDLVSTIDHFANHPARHSLYSVSDGVPPTRQQYYDFIAQIGQWPSPVFVPNDPTPLPPLARKSRSGANKQVSAKRLQNEFSNFAFRNYQIGLLAILKEIIANANPS
jgi:nucleoside-diphosphate-sugar epimerase